jgi:RNA polymerase sigma-70 factor (ECF subfamily)
VSKIRKDLEEAIAAELAGGDLTAAAEGLFRGYGPVFLGFLHARCRSDDVANEAFSEFCEDLWKGLSGFEARSSARVWAFTLARHAAIRVESSPHRRAQRRIALSQISGLSRLVDQVRSETVPHLRTERRTHLEALRATLTPDEQTLLVLRVDKGLAWNDIASVFFEGGDEAARAELSVRLRKRFQLLKERLRTMARGQP